MSYLDTALRIQFAGDFVAAPSTVNNDLAHYDNSTFDPSFQLPGTRTAANGWWNPRGDHAFKIDSRLRNGCYADGSIVSADDPALTASLLTVNTPPGSIVDLDPQQQMVSTLYGVRLMIPNRVGGVPLLQGQLATVSFTNIWHRGLSGRGDEAACATYQSVLESLTWGDVAVSRLFTELRAAATDGLLSVKFSLDGYNMDSTSPRFTMGRIVGTIGSARANEPRHFVVGRHLEVPAWLDSPPMPLPGIRPKHDLNYAVAVVDEDRGKVRIDLGNSIPVDPAGGAPANLGAMDLVCDAASVSPLNLGPVSYTGPGWYEATAGILELPEGRTLTPSELARVKSKPLTVRLGAAHTVALVEHPNGLSLRADDMVWRLNPDEDRDVVLWATQWGKPLVGATITLSFGRPFEPETGVPTSALAFSASVTTNAQGTAIAQLHGGDPANPRGFIDGQVYRVDYKLQGERQGNLSEFLSILVWDRFAPDVPSTWLGSMKKIFVQYANLYPVMATVMNLADYEDVISNRLSIIDRLRMPETDARHMPITRDLSVAKRDAIVAWLTNVGADGKPLFAPPTPAFDQFMGKAVRAQRLTK